MDKYYFENQRKNPTGKFTEMMIRTYFLIYKACTENGTDNCFDSQVEDRKICSKIYEGFYDDNPANLVISTVFECKKKLKKLKYISFFKDKVSDKWMIKIQKELDFLTQEERNDYFLKYEITSEIKFE